MSATGERKWNSTSVQAKGFKERTPLPAKTWEFIMKTTRAEIRKKDQYSAPYINFYMEAEGSAEEGSDKNRGVYHMLFLGSNMLDRTDGLKGLLLATGRELEDLPLMEGTDADQKSFDYADPQEVLAWLKQLDGERIKAKTKIDTSGQSPSARVVFFVEQRK